MLGATVLEQHHAEPAIVPLERRMQSAAFPFEIRAGGQPGTFSGIASRYGELDAHGTILDPGVFADSLREHIARNTWPPMLWHHEGSQPIGVWTSIREDAQGLQVEGRLTLEVARAKEVHALLRDGAVRGVSVGFRPVQYVQKESGPIRFTRADLIEISLTPTPSNAGAKITSVRTLGSIRDLEHALTEIGLSRREAKAVAARGWAGLASAEDEEQARAMVARAAALRGIAERFQA
jgi:uncharacterized protein